MVETKHRIDNIIDEIGSRIGKLPRDEAIESIKNSLEYYLQLILEALGLYSEDKKMARHNDDWVLELARNFFYNHKIRKILAIKGINYDI
jgi:hypothetical protein